MINIDTYVDIGRGLQLSIVNSEWVVFVNDKLFPLRDEMDFFRVVSLLELPPEQVQEKLDQLKILSGDNFGFPFEAIVKAGLSSSSDYWVGLALSWLKILSLEKKAELKSILVMISHSKWSNQKIRQIADREVKTISHI